MRMTEINVSQYNAIVEIYVAKLKELNKFMKKAGMDDMKSTHEARSIWNEKNSRYAIFFRSDVKINAGIIVHECKHIINFIYQAKDIYPDRNNDEAECYLLEFVVNKVTKILKNNKVIK